MRQLACATVDIAVALDDAHGAVHVADVVEIGVEREQRIDGHVRGRERGVEPGDVGVRFE